MQFLIRAIIATSYFAITAKALPKPYAAVTYSVVNVDGGSSTQAAAATPTTIYKTITESQSPPPVVETTVSVTILESPSTTQATSTRSVASSTSLSSVFSTATSTSSAVAASVNTTYWPESIDPITTSSSSFLPSTSGDPVIEVSAYGPEATVTVTSVSIETPTPSSTTYYDNGMWHTSYPVKTWWTPLPASQTRSARNQTVTDLDRRGASTPTSISGVDD